MSEPLRQARYDASADAMAVWIFGSDFHVTARPDLYLTTTLGSCIAVCMRDPEAGCGGMNHFLLPELAESASEKPGYALRFGSYSIERLTNAILKRGGKRERLEAKVFGGANMMSVMTEIGTRNAEFVQTYLKREGISVLGQDLGGGVARKLRYYPVSGRAQVAKVYDSEALSTFMAERTMGRTMPEMKGEVKVFDPRM